MVLRNWFSGVLIVVCAGMTAFAAPSQLLPVVAADSSDAAPDPAFRSGLWRSQYAGQDSVPEVADEAAESDVSASTQQYAQHLVHASTVAELGEFAGLPVETGEFSDSGAAARLTPERTAWHTAYIEGSGVFGTTRKQTGGPSVTIVLVGFVALIVLGGSSLSGRG